MRNVWIKGEVFHIQVFGLGSLASSALQRLSAPYIFVACLLVQSFCFCILCSLLVLFLRSFDSHRRRGHSG